jgi:hypothetical protein
VPGEWMTDAPRPRRWSMMVERKLEALAEQEHRLAVARTALEHARHCPAKHPSLCPRFWTIIDAQLDGVSLEDSHAMIHGTPPTPRSVAAPHNTSRSAQKWPTDAIGRRYAIRRSRTS